jgi:hypothetical protein
LSYNALLFMSVNVQRLRLVVAGRGWTGMKALARLTLLAALAGFAQAEGAAAWAGPWQGAGSFAETAPSALEAAGVTRVATRYCEPSHPRRRRHARVACEAPPKLRYNYYYPAYYWDGNVYQGWQYPYYGYPNCGWPFERGC